VQADQITGDVGDIIELRVGREMMTNPETSPPFVNTELLHAPEGSGVSTNG